MRPRRSCTSVGLLAGDRRNATYLRTDGTRRRIDHGADIVRTGPPPEADVPLVVQISRWDRLKDMAGVMDGFADFVVGDHGSQLVLAGPVVSSVSDDPEGASVLARLLGALASPPPPRPLAHRHLLPADDRRRGERHHRQRPAAPCRGGRAEEPGRRLRLDGRRGDVQAADRRRQRRRRHPGPDRRRRVGTAAARSHRPRRLHAPARRHRPRRATTSRDGERARQRVIDRFLPDRQLRAWSAVLEAAAGVR